MDTNEILQKLQKINPEIIDVKTQECETTLRNTKRMDYV